MFWTLKTKVYQNHAMMGRIESEENVMANSVIQQLFISLLEKLSPCAISGVSHTTVGQDADYRAQD